MLAGTAGECCVLLANIYNPNKDIENRATDPTIVKSLQIWTTSNAANVMRVCGIMVWSMSDC